LFVLSAPSPDVQAWADQTRTACADHSLRLLISIPDGYPTFRADVVTLFGKYLPRHGIASDLIAHPTEPDSSRLPAWGGGNVVLCPAISGRIKKHLTFFRFVTRQLLQARRHRYDAIQVRDSVFTALLGLWVARREGIPFFYWMSYPMYESKIERVRTRGLSMGLTRYVGVAAMGYVGKWLLYRRVLRASDHVFVQSDKMVQDVARQGIPTAKMSAVLMGADLEEMSVSRVEPARDERLTGRRVILYLGTLVRIRRIDFLFDVLVRVKQQVSNVVLVLAGDSVEPSDLEWLHQRAKEAGVANDVVWTGWLPIEEGWRFVRASEVALSPFRPSFELDSCSPTKAIEYLALGVPAVGNDQPDQARVIRDSGAGHCVPYSVEAFADAILHLLEHPDLARQMGARGPAYVAAHRSYEIIARDLARTYARLLGPAVNARRGASGR
jgi:glycosyltransferase involved in cell wall biosynthesis